MGDHDGAVELLRRLDRRRFPDCGTAGPMAATAARSWTRKHGASRSRWCSAATAAAAALATARGDPADRVPVRGRPEPLGGGADLRVAGPFRRLSKDYEHLTTTSEAVIYLAMTRLLVRRLTRRPGFSDTL